MFETWASRASGGYAGRSHHADHVCARRHHSASWEPSGTLFPFFGSRFPYKVTSPKQGALIITWSLGLPRLGVLGFYLRSLYLLSRREKAKATPSHKQSFVQIVADASRMPSRTPYSLFDLFGGCNPCKPLKQKRAPFKFLGYWATQAYAQIQLENGVTEEPTGEGKVVEVVSPNRADELHESSM